jgi:DNA repair protein RadA/Sms
MAQSNLDVILNQLRQNKPDAVIVDSIQMVYRPDLPSVPGSATQLRDCASRLVWLAKQTGFALLLVGHVTKDGAIAGPKVLEHIVDCVVYFEGERFASHRLIRAAKNRFGSTDELGVFEMTDAGLRAVEDPSKLFLDTARTSRPGSVILAACEGTRVLLVEVQALCVQSVFGAAKRKATGVDANRVAMILAVIEKHAGCVLGDQDVFVNIVGGIRVIEPAADLAIALAVVGTMTNRCLPEGAAAFGELGLGGEIRSVHHTPRRIAEAQRIGLTTMVLPARGAHESPARDERGAREKTSGSMAHPAQSASTIQNQKTRIQNSSLVTCRTLADAIRQLA